MEKVICIIIIMMREKITEIKSGVKTLVKSLFYVGFSWIKQHFETNKNHEYQISSIDVNSKSHVLMQWVTCMLWPVFLVFSQESRGGGMTVSSLGSLIWHFCRVAFFGTISQIRAICWYHCLKLCQQISTSLSE